MVYKQKFGSEYHSETNELQNIFAETLNTFRYRSTSIETIIGRQVF